MESKIMFLIVAILGIYLVFTPTGQTAIKKLMGVITTGTTTGTGTTTTVPTDPSKDMSGGPIINSGVSMG